MSEKLQGGEKGRLEHTIRRIFDFAENIDFERLREPDYQAYLHLSKNSIYSPDETFKSSSPLPADFKGSPVDMSFAQRTKALYIESQQMFEAGIYNSYMRLRAARTNPEKDLRFTGLIPVPDMTNAKELRHTTYMKWESPDYSGFSLANFTGIGLNGEEMLIDRLTFHSSLLSSDNAIYTKFYEDGRWRLLSHPNDGIETADAVMRELRQMIR